MLDRGSVCFGGTLIGVAVVVATSSGGGFLTRNPKILGTYLAPSAVECDVARVPIPTAVPPPSAAIIMTNKCAKVVPQKAPSSDLCRDDRG